MEGPKTHPGDEVRVVAFDGRFLGIGAIHPGSQLRIRMFAFEQRKIDQPFFEERIQNAFSLRNSILNSNTDVCRLLHSEGDFLPGLIMDRYGSYGLVQFLTAGMERKRQEVLGALIAAAPGAGLKSLHERSDAEARLKEGLQERTGLLWGEPVPPQIQVRENGIVFWVDPHHGQKGGFFADQRDNRVWVEKHAAGRSVLNCFAYTGGFSLYAFRGGAERAVSVDTSQPALDLLEENLAANRWTDRGHQGIRADVFEYLRAGEEKFGLIVLDPPAFCKRKDQVDAAARGYKDINRLAIRKLTPGGLLFSFSCSSFIDADLFQKILFAAAREANRSVRILGVSGQPEDHPINIFHPEGQYLKGFLLHAE